MKIGYARVSSQGQDLESQIRQLKREGCERIFSEKFTGIKKDRPQFKEVLDLLKEGDTLVVTKLDRFARSTVDGIQTVKELFERNVKVHILNMGLVENTATGRLIFSIMSSFSEFERDMIVERTQEGKAVARLREDYQEGRPRKYKRQQVDHALNLLEKHTYKEVEAMTGISKRTLIRRKNERKSKELETE
ncbi:recombinase family protein [Priestia megaterium]|uniref:recombinase family protein n=1 Tax=Priestia megaterium TaxID=1404 RepID=UPI002877F52E|nr:recombinase family protein [Priestia megaterium]